MAPRPRRALRQHAATVSYAESSDDHMDDNDYVIDEDASDDALAGSAINTYLRPSTRSADRRRGTSLKRPLPPDPDQDVICTPNMRVKIPRRSRKPHTRSKGRPKQSAPQRRRTITSSPDHSVTPPWQSLPYHIWLDIFTYASYPLVDMLHATPSVQWLLATSRICKAMAEPALTALYRDPPLVRVSCMRKLLQLLQSPTAAVSFSYAQKIRSLKFSFISTSQAPLNSRTRLEIEALIAQVPLLTDIDCSSQAANQKWIPGMIIKALQYSNPRLRAWVWNLEMLEFWYAPKTMSVMEEVHETPSFQCLTHLRLAHFDFGGPSDGHRCLKEGVAAAVARLPNLYSLAFIDCVEVGEEFLLMLPPNLTEFTIYASHSCTLPQELRAFLFSHGRSLRKLSLQQSQSVVLLAILDLATSCPNLEVLEAVFLDEPFPHLLEKGVSPSADQVASWPKSLQIIDITHSSELSIEAAENFLRSLIISANHLSHLRRLELSFTLDAGWRDRAGFRDTWARRMKRCFLRKSKHPSLLLRSISAWEAHKTFQAPRDNCEVVISRGESPGAGMNMSGARNDGADLHLSPPTRNGRSKQMRTGRRSTRIATQQKDPVQSLETSDGSMHMDAHHYSDSDEGQAEETMDFHRQGMCDVVKFAIDNMRPMEHRFHEKDFLDDEPSGDEDWDGTQEFEDFS